MVHGLTLNHEATPSWAKEKEFKWLAQGCLPQATLLDGELALSPLAPYCQSSLHDVLHEAKCRILSQRTRMEGKLFSCCHVPKKKWYQGEKHDGA